jgi:hypothetical protein
VLGTERAQRLRPHLRRSGDDQSGSRLVRLSRKRNTGDWRCNAQCQCYCLPLPSVDCLASSRPVACYLWPVPKTVFVFQLFTCFPLRICALYGNRNRESRLHHLRIAGGDDGHILTDRLKRHHGSFESVS